MIFEAIYNKGYEAGVNAQKLSDHEDQNRRLEDMLHHGKKIGRDEGFFEGYEKGYKFGYSEGEKNAKAEIGEINIDVLEAMAEEIEGGDADADMRGGDSE